MFACRSEGRAKAKRRQSEGKMTPRIARIFTNFLILVILVIRGELKIEIITSPAAVAAPLSEHTPACGHPSKEGTRYTRPHINTFTHSHINTFKHSSIQTFTKYGFSVFIASRLWTLRTGSAVLWPPYFRPQRAPLVSKRTVMRARVDGPPARTGLLAKGQNLLPRTGEGYF